MEVDRENIAAAAGRSGGDTVRPSAPSAAGCVPTPSPPGPRPSRLQRRGSMTHTYPLPLIFDALIHVADDLYYHLQHCETCEVGCSRLVCASLSARPPTSARAAIL